MFGRVLGLSSESRGWWWSFSYSWGGFFASLVVVVTGWRWWRKEVDFEL